LADLARTRDLQSAMAEMRGMPGRKALSDSADSRPRAQEKGA